MHFRFFLAAAALSLPFLGGAAATPATSSAPATPATPATASTPAAPATPLKAATLRLDLESLTHSPGVVSASLSPDGSKLAIIEYKYYTLTVYVSNVKEVAFKAILREKYEIDGFWGFWKKPRSVMWLNNEIIVVNYNLGASSFTVDGKFIADLGEGVVRRISAVNDPVPMVLAYTDIEGGKLARVNALNGKKTRLSFPVSGKPLAYTFDPKGEARVITTADSTFWKDVNTFSHWYRPAGKADWKKVAEFKVTDDIWVPLFVPDDSDRIIVSSRADRDTSAIFSLDVNTGKLGKMLAGFPDVDVVGFQKLSADGMERVTTSGMLPAHLWFDPEWSALQKEVDLALPRRINTLSGNPKGTVLVYSQGDVDPGTYYLLDTTDFSMRKFGSFHATIDPASMRPVQDISYPSYDGLPIPAYLTLPKDGQRALPAVIMIHGGPQYRDFWEFDADVQLLASRGYAVLQPQFRGSSGFGKKFEAAGYGQWGMAMQDDISAGVDYLVRQGIADPKRICIYGQSYGGYAALWGLAKTPGLYKCGISFAGVADIEMIFNTSSDFSGDRIAMELVRSRIGDPKVNRQQFEMVSPLRHAGRITAPVLLMHGREDKRVPYAHGKKMLKALNEHGKQVEWLDFEDEGHALSRLNSRRAYFAKVLEFLDKHIGSTGPAPAAPALTP